MVSLLLSCVHTFYSDTPIYGQDAEGETEEAAEERRCGVFTFIAQ